MRLRWLMDEQQKAEIGARLRDLRDNSPETNRSIGDVVGVSERTVAAWVGGEQGMTYDHAKGVARLFDVDIDWLWRGREKGPAPELSERLAAIEATVSDLQRDMAWLVAREKADAARAQARERQPSTKQPRAPRKKASGS